MSPHHSPALRFTIRGQSFCHNMVRCLVSTMVAIGRGELDEKEIAVRLSTGDRYQLPQPAPAAGLALIGVGYDEGRRRLAFDGSNECAGRTSEGGAGDR